MTLKDFITLRDKCVEEFDAKLSRECKDPVVSVACREAFRQGFEAAYAQPNPTSSRAWQEIINNLEIHPEIP